MTLKTILASAILVVAAASATTPALAQFNEQTIPQECLDEHGRFVLTGENMEACQQYAYVK